VVTGDLVGDRAVAAAPRTTPGPLCFAASFPTLPGRRPGHAKKRFVLVLWRLLVGSQ
jgi:hypothetical protein